MRLFRNLLIRRKLTLLMVLTTTVSLVLVCAAWLGSDYVMSQRDFLRSLEMMSEVTGKNVSSAILFEDPEFIDRAFEEFADQPHIRLAIAYDLSGHVVSSYRAPGLAPDHPLPAHLRSGHAYVDDGLIVYSPVYLDGDEIGTLALVSDGRAVRERLTVFGVVITCVLLVSAVLSFLMASRLQAVISAPVLQLAETAREVSSRRDYSVRAEKHGADELGFLTDSFNRMLAQIQDRDAELEKHRNTLEEKVDLRTRELTQLNRRLRRSMEAAKAAAVAKSHFLANMSHEIRTPMNGVIGMIELLLDTEMADQQRSYAEVVKNSAESLLDIINDILDFSKIEAGKLQLERIEFDLYQTVEEVTELLSSSARKKALELVCWIAPDVPQVVVGDPTRLRQIITNLVGNAIKFTADGRVALRVRQVAETDDGVELRFDIEDTGIGIPSERKDRLFQSFSQIDPSTTRQFGGTGLGLAISRQLTQLMGGDITVESELGVGSTFSFVIRLGRGQRVTGRTFDLPPGAPAPRVLVSDPSAAVRDALHQQFVAWSLEHTIVGSAAQAVELLQAGRDEGKPYRVLLVDVAEAAEAQEVFVPEGPADTPVVLGMAWSGEANDVRELLGLPVPLRVDKPIRSSHLFDTIANGLGLPSRTPAKDPADAVEPAASEQPDADVLHSTLAGLRVLLAEDNRINQVVATKILTREGIGCDVVEDGKAAVDAVASGVYDLVLMDCQMPVMDGFEATRRIREAEQRRADAGEDVTPIHVIALTANAMKGDRARCLAAGMDEYLSKPVKPDSLVQQLRSFASELRRRRDAEGSRPSAETDELDLDAILLRFADDQAALLSAIADFDRETLECLGKMRYCLGSEDEDEVLVHLKRFEEASSLLASRRLLTLVQRLEQLARDGRFPEALEAFDEAHRELARCRDVVPELLARAGGK
jgi:signal transduction histidine kinase